MSREGLTYDRKALAAVLDKPDWNDLAKDAVAFAAARGGTIDIGIPDRQREPPPEQRIEGDLADLVARRIGELTISVSVAAEILTAGNGGQILRLHITRSSAMPSRSDGRFFLRIGDQSRPITANDVQRLVAERASVPWEVTDSPAKRGQLEPTAWSRLVARLRASERVKRSVKDKTDDELLDHYRLANDGALTNLGVLCVGRPMDRARLGTGPIVQAITYDDHGDKIGKQVWDDHTLSPIEMIDAIWAGVPAFRESYELRHGLLTQQLPAYDEAVIREVLVNALVHRPYTQRGDIFLNLHPDRLEVVNPGPFPPGVTAANILHTTVRRNDEMARLFHDLGLMEREGSGFNLMYERLLASGRQPPIPREGPDRVAVTIHRRVVKPAMVALMNAAAERLQLNQRETIVLGLLALHDGRTALELVEDLSLDGADDLTPWLGQLQSLNVIKSTGRTKGTRYFIPPVVLQRLDFTPRTTLTRIEPHRLTALVVEDVQRYPRTSIGEIHTRVGTEIPRPRLKRCLAQLVRDGQLATDGIGRWTRYRTAEDLA